MIVLTTQGARVKWAPFYSNIENLVLPAARDLRLARIVYFKLNHL